MNKPKILFFDIETSPTEGGVWSKWETNLLYVTEHSQLLSVAYKWQGSSKIHCITMRDKKSDKQVIKELYKLFDEADILVAHNGDQFDVKRVTARMIYYDFPPTKKLTSVDTKKEGKRYFGFLSNSLNDMAEYFGLGAKVQHTGIGLWRGCKVNDAASWALMEKYNKQDVVLLEKVYDRMFPWMQTHPNIAKLINPQENRRGICPKCGSTHVEKRGYRATQASIKQQWVCKDCDSWFLTAVEKK